MKEEVRIPQAFKKTNFASATLSSPPRDAYANKVVLITGASSGIVSFLLLQCLYVVRYPTFASNLEIIYQTDICL